MTNIHKQTFSTSSTEDSHLHHLQTTKFSFSGEKKKKKNRAGNTDNLNFYILSVLSFILLLAVLFFQIGACV